MAGLPVAEGMPFGETIPSWNVAPGTACPIVRTELGQQPAMDNLLWGLIPHWATERPKTRPINARLETAAEKPMFRRIFRYRRCLVAADGWFEWKEEEGGKHPYFIRFADSRPFFLAGLWDEWIGPDGPVPTFTILTHPAPPSILDIHDRAPVILRPEAYPAWLAKDLDDPGQVMKLCEPKGPERLIAFRVGPAVGRTDQNGPALIEPMPA